MTKCKKVYATIGTTALLVGGALVYNNVQDVQASLARNNPQLHNNISQVWATHSGNSGSQHGTTVGARVRMVNLNDEVSFSMWGTSFVQSGSTTATSPRVIIRNGYSYRAEGFVAVGPKNITYR